ncbi:S-adenosyl-L-methionine-dependent methyltransferase, partial [Spinellus fusiger]
LLKPDEDEADRIQLKSDLIKLAFSEECALPINLGELQQGRILDVGCGTGSWCMDIATQNPSVQVFGVDSVNMFPDPANVPFNCHFIMHNVLDGLSDLTDSSFDFVHIRFMALSFPYDQYTQMIKDCWKLLRPGGYLEIMEADMTVYSPGPVTARLNKEGR